MDSSLLQTVLFALAGGVLGAFGGWLAHAFRARHRIDEVRSAALVNLDEITAQRDELAGRYSTLREKVGPLQTVLDKRNSELAAVRKKSKLLAGNLHTLRTERESTKVKLGAMQNALGSLKRRTSSLQSEFAKTQDFYKRELAKAFEKRKMLEDVVKEARSEQEEFTQLVESSTLEHGSTENMVIAAQLRLGQLQVLERNVNKLEAENAHLQREIARLKQEYDARDRELSELKELRIHNRQLVQCVEALEGSRKESEELSDTLRLKLDDLEKNFADIQEQQDQAIEEARNSTVAPMRRHQQ
jgi:chromosome segregation ATPase